MTWLDNIVVALVVVVGVVILYRALKEPLDMVGALILRGVNSIRDKISGYSAAPGYEIIEYGG